MHNNYYTCHVFHSINYTIYDKTTFRNRALIAAITFVTHQYNYHRIANLAMINASYAVANDFTYSFSNINQKWSNVWSLPITLLDSPVFNERFTIHNTLPNKLHNRVVYAFKYFCCLLSHSIHQCDFISIVSRLRYYIDGRENFHRSSVNFSIYVKPCMVEMKV